MNSPIANMYSIGYFQLGQHMAFIHALADNNIKFETTTHTEYSEGAYSIEIVTFYIHKNDYQSAKQILKTVQKETPEFKSYPKFKKIFWVMMLIIFILFMIVFGLIIKFDLTYILN